jgi:hypothetical protein
LTNPPDGDQRWTTRTIASRTGLTQSTVARTLKAAGLNPGRVPMHEPHADPMFEGRARVLVGLRMGQDQRLLAFAVADERPRTHRALEPHPAAAERFSRIWENTTGLITDLCSPARPQSAPEDHRGLLAYLERLRTGLPRAAKLHVIFDRPLAENVHRWLATRSDIITHHTPGVRSWQTIARRVVAASAAVLVDHGQDDGVPGVQAALTAWSCRPTPTRTAWEWTIEPTGTDLALASLNRRPSRTRRATALLEPGDALTALRVRHQPREGHRQPAYEYLLAVSSSADPTRVARQDCVNAMTVLAHLERTLNAAELAVLAYAADWWTKGKAVANELGITASALPGHRRRLQAACSGQSRMTYSSAVPDVDRAHRDRGRGGLNPVDQRIEDLQERWQDSLAAVDAEAHLRERLPGRGDRFGVLTQIVAVGDRGEWSIEDRQGEALVGVAIVADLRHRLPEIRLKWYDLARHAKARLADLGAAFGWDTAATWEDRKRLAARAAETAEVAVDAARPKPAASAPIETREYWEPNEPEIREFRNVVMSDRWRPQLEAHDDFGYWLDELDQVLTEMGVAPSSVEAVGLKMTNAQFTRVHGLALELAQSLTFGDEPAFVELAQQAAALKVALSALRSK